MLEFRLEVFEDGVVLVDLLSEACLTRTHGRGRDGVDLIEVGDAHVLGLAEGPVARPEGLLLFKLTLEYLTYFLFGLFDYLFDIRSIENWIRANEALLVLLELKL